MKDLDVIKQSLERQLEKTIADIEALNVHLRRPEYIAKAQLRIDYKRRIALKKFRNELLAKIQLLDFEPEKVLRKSNRR
jgi:hypothetical protein